MFQREGKGYTVCDYVGTDTSIILPETIRGRAVAGIFDEAADRKSTKQDKIIAYENGKTIINAKKPSRSN